MSIIKCCFDVESSELVDSVAQKCTGPGCCCGCCSALRPRYKRLVDNIFPVLPQDGLVKNNMEKLTFYALSSPEKLDRIGEYLYQKAGRDIYRRRYGFVVIAMEAMDQLLLACHAQTLNLFVESFLKMVQKLLESTEPELQTMATQSFVRFANIEEDTPSYHRRYDFFVSKFSSMCHNNDDNPSVRDSIRLAGIKGLQGVVRKTVSDDLVENIWESVHMDKIVPSLLYNMQNSRYIVGENDSNRSGNDPNEADSPPNLSESCLRELVGRASFGHIRSVLRPVLRHLDLHELWVPNHFAIHTFKVIMFSIQAQYSYAVVEALMDHLDENSKANPKIKTSIADVLSKIIAIAAGESVGPSVLEIINSLLTHLRTSVSSPSKHKRHETDEKLYQEALINALGEFANHLPDYQKIEIMMFIMSKVPYDQNHDRHDQDSSELLLENILLKSLLKVGSKYQTIHFNTTFPMSFLKPLLEISLAPDPDMRVLVQKILHTLIDRHGNLEKLLKPTINVSELELQTEKCSRPDMIFIRKHGYNIFKSLYEGLELPNNTIENIESIYTTLALLTVELITEETVVDVFRLLYDVQNMTIASTTLSETQKANLHAVVVSSFLLVLDVVQISCLSEYAEAILQVRKENYPQLLPDFGSMRDSDSVSPSPDALLDLNEIVERLKASGFDVTRLLQPPPGYVGGPARRLSCDESGIRRSPTADLGTYPTEVDSVNSSPGLQKKYPEEELTFDSMKKILAEAAEVKKAAEDERRMRITETFRSATFQELVDRTQAKSYVLQTKLDEILGKLKEGVAPVTVTAYEENPVKPPAYEILFPELFVY